MYPNKPQNIFKLAQESGIQSVSSLFPTESQIAQILALSISSYLTYLMIKTLRDQNTYQAKQSKPDSETNKINFQDIGGCEAAKKAIFDMIDFMQYKQKYLSMGIKMPRSILLYGPPGTGKTMVAKAAATEANMPVLYASGSEFVELYVGMGAKRVRELFTQAKMLAQQNQLGFCMIFIDEIDAVGYQRKGQSSGGLQGSTSHRESETTLNQLLNEIDGFDSSENIIIIAATNLIENLDPALLRPGRFDHKIQINLPNPLERVQILKVHLRNKNHCLKQLDITKAATMMDGWTGAEIHNAINLAAIDSVKKQCRIQLIIDQQNDNLNKNNDQNGELNIELLIQKINELKESKSEQNKLKFDYKIQDILNLQNNQLIKNNSS